MHRAKLVWGPVFAAAIVMVTAAFGSARPLAAFALLEGRTNDQAHDSGYLDWSGPVQYVYLTHRDGSWLPADEGGAYCGSGCQEWITRLSAGGMVSGSFASDPGTFELNLALSHDSNVGNAVLKACSATQTSSLYVGSGNGLPGFVSFGLSVPAGCRTWALSASGGYIDFQAVEVYYAAPPPIPTRTATAIPSITPSPTLISTSTVTPSITPTATNTLTATATNTPTFTPTPTDTPTSTPTATPSPTPTPLPPQITGQVVCDAWGNAGWCKGNESLELIASDPQGYTVSISGDTNGVLFSCLDSCSVPLPEGTGSSTYMVTSTSGQTASGTASWQRDITPPMLGWMLPTVNGLDGWYVSALDVDVSASDAISGIASMQARVDDGSGWTSLPLHLEDGFYPLAAHALDSAGNETIITAMVRVDTTAPISQFTSLSDGVVVRGNITTAGEIADWLSGAAGGQISLDDGGTWQAVSMASGGAWSYAWDTTAVSDGPHLLHMEGSDSAGNVGKPARVSILVDNHPPIVSLTSHWWIGEEGILQVSPNYFPLATAKLTISDPEGRWPAREVQFSPAQIPETVSWDRRFADGTVAPPGDYGVVVQACDPYSLCSTGSGLISIPAPMTAPRHTPAPVWSVPNSTPTGTVPQTAPPRATSTASDAVHAPTQVAVTTVAPVPARQPSTANIFPWWALLGLLGLFLAVSSASVTDPRPVAIGHLREVMHQISVLAKQYENKDR